MQDQKIVEISYVTDDETGMYKIGEGNFSILLPECVKFIKEFGEKGVNEICQTLDELKDALRGYLME